MERHCTCVFAAALALSATVVTQAPASTPLPPYPAATTKIASGHWNGVRWTLYAGELVSNTSFSHCTRLVLGPNSPGNSACSSGGLRKPGELLPTSPPAPGSSYGMSFGGSTDCPAFYVYVGIVLANARHVTLTLSNGKTVTTPTIPSPPGFAQSLRFWATHTPCGTSITGMVGRDAAGKVVARINSRFLRFGH
jgi:hypothetical protein